MRKRIIKNISENLKTFAKDYFFFQIAVACCAFAVAIVFFIIKPEEKSFVIAGVCCVAGSLIYVAKAYMTLLLFHGLCELIETNHKILKELGGDFEHEEEKKEKEVKLENVYDTIDYDPETRLKRKGKVFIRDRFVSVNSRHISFSEILNFDKGNEMLENYGFEDINYAVYHIKTKTDHYYFSIVDEAEEKKFRKELHEKLTKSKNKDS